MERGEESAATHIYNRRPGVFTEHKDIQLDAGQEHASVVPVRLVQTVRDNAVKERIEQLRQPNDNLKDKWRMHPEIPVVSIF